MNLPPYTRVGAHASIDHKQMENVLIDNGLIDRTGEIEGVIPFSFEESFQRWTDETLKRRFAVDFVRTPSGERMLFYGAVYVGIVKVRNETYQCDYEMYVWVVRYERANHTDYEHPLKGLLMIRAKHWRNMGYPEPETAFRGKCVLVASKKRQIVSMGGYGEDKLLY